MTTQLTTTAAFKQYLNITGTTDDAQIAFLVTAVSELIANTLNRDVGTQTFTETYDGSGNRRQVVSNYPITSVTSVRVDGALQQAATGVLSAGYRFDRFSVFFNLSVFPEGIQNVQLVYVAGYTTVPPDLAQACLETMANIYRTATRIGESSKAMGGGGQTSYSLKDIPATAMKILNNYTKRSPV